MILVTLVFPLVLFALVMLLYRVEQRLVLGESDSGRVERPAPRRSRRAVPLQSSGPVVTVGLDVSGGFDGALDARPIRAPRAVSVRVGSVLPTSEEKPLGADQSGEATGDGAVRRSAA